MAKEKEEMILLERDRMGSIYAEKEKDLEERVNSKDTEIARLREEMLHAKHDKEIVVGQFVKERDELKQTITELNDKYNQAESEHHLKLENTLKRETDRFHSALEKKRVEIDGIKTLKESQDDSYRKSLDNFRVKLSDAVGKLESIKHIADDRQNQIASLHMEMVESKKNYEMETMTLKGKLSDSLKRLKEIKDEHESLKNKFSSYSDENRKTINETMVKLRKTEEYAKSVNDKLGEARSEIEAGEIEAAKKEEDIKKLYLESENQRSCFVKIADESRKKETAYGTEKEMLESEISQRENVVAQLNEALKNKNTVIAEKEVSKKKLRDDLMAKSNEDKLKFDIERKEFQMSIEKLIEKTREQQKALRNENNALKESFVDKDILIEKLNGEFKGLLEKSSMYKSGLDESLKKVKELENAYDKAASDNEMLKSGMNDIADKYKREKDFIEIEKKKRTEVDKALAKKDSVLRDTEEEIKGLADQLGESERSFNRARDMYEDEKKKKEELDVVAQASSSALREKEEKNRKLARALDHVKEDLSLNLKLMEEKDEAIKVLSDDVSSLHEFRKDYEKGLKIIGQLKQRIKSWKKN